MNFSRTAILGAGGWGTALAVVWAKKGNRILLWGHDAERAARLRETRVNATYLPGIELPASIEVTSDLREAGGADLIVVVTPSTAVRNITTSLRPFVNPAAVLLSCTKGIEHGSGLRITEVLEAILPGHITGVLSGPNLAVEVARDLPSATVLGCARADCGRALQQHLGTARLRVYSSEETAAIELGGALKNVFAIPAGVSDGLGLGDNAKAALVTRALAEMVRLGTAMGGEARAFYGLSGAGDLIATCFSQHSRNRRVGEEIGRGRPIAEITASMRTVAEGIPTTKSAYECARRLGVDAPIIEQAYALLYEGKRPLQALEELLGRDQKSEGG